MISLGKKVAEVKPVENRPTFLSGLISRDDETFEKILVKMIEPKDASSKTEIHQPLALTQLEEVAVWLRSEKQGPAADAIKEFVNLYRVNMISYNRQSRKEVIQALTEGLKLERTMTDKMAGKPS